MNWLGLTISPFLLFGANKLTFPFLMTRIISCNLKLTRWQKYCFGSAIIIFYIGTFLAAILVEYFHGNYFYFGIQLAIILLWFSLITLFFIKYPEDELVRELQQYILSLLNLVRDNKTDAK
jgi:hypothetical protein